MKSKSLLIAFILLGIGIVTIIGVFLGATLKGVRLFAGNYQTKDFTFSDTIHDIDIRVYTTDIEVKEAARDDFHVTVREEEHTPLRVYMDGTTLTVFQEEEKWYNNLLYGIHIGNSGPRISIEIPIGYDKALSLHSIATSGDLSYDCSLPLQMLNCRSTTGSITMDHARAAALTVGLTTGSLELLRTTAGSATVTLTTGDSEIRNCSFGNLTMEAKTGDVEMSDTNVDGILKVTTTTGDQELEKIDATEIHLKATTGDIEISVVTPCWFFATATTGDIHVPKSSPFPSSEFRPGNCYLETTTGDIDATIVKSSPTT